MGRSDLNAVQAQVRECVLDESAARARHDPEALEGLREPVPDLRLPAHPVPVVKAHDANEFAAIPDPRLEAIVPAELRHPAANELRRVPRGPRAVHPREPRAEVPSVRVGQGEQCGRVSRREDPEFDLRVHGNPRGMSAGDPGSRPPGAGHLRSWYNSSQIMSGSITNPTMYFGRTSVFRARVPPRAMSRSISLSTSEPSTSNARWSSSLPDR